MTVTPVTPVPSIFRCTICRLWHLTEEKHPRLPWLCFSCSPWQIGAVCLLCYPSAQDGGLCNEHKKRATRLRRDATIKGEMGEMGAGRWRACLYCGGRYQSRDQRSAHCSGACGKLASRQNRARCLEVAPGRHTSAEWLAKLATYDGLCAYCDNAATTKDHVIPLIRGGSDDISNIVPACLPCNSSKGSRLLAEWGREPVRVGI